jgi:hypothetical protein
MEKRFITGPQFIFWLLFSIGINLIISVYIIADYSSKIQNERTYVLGRLYKLEDRVYEIPWE